MKLVLYKWSVYVQFVSPIRCIFVKERTKISTIGAYISVDQFDGTHEGAHADKDMTRGVEGCSAVLGSRSAAPLDDDAAVHT